MIAFKIVYPGAEAITQMEDTQPLETPIIAPVKAKQFEIIEKELPRTTFGYEYVDMITGQFVIGSGIRLSFIDDGTF